MLDLDASSGGIAVVIPYYQREEGILRRALRSVGAQVGVANVTVIVVDDQSPSPVEKELADIEGDCNFPVSVVSRTNGGPGAARNSGLEHVPAGTSYVAFLDSDDEWKPYHLKNACAALSAGYTVYFADLMQLGAPVSSFSRAQRIDPKEHPVIGPFGHLHAYEGDMLAQIVSGNVIGTSTVVYRWDRFATVRFRPEFRTAGEDYLFWMDLAACGARFAFSDLVEAVYGKGVNVYAGAQWGSVDLLWRIHYELRYREFSACNYPLAHELQQTIDEKKRALVAQFAKVLRHRLLRFKGVPWKLVKEQVALAPATLAAVLSVRR